VGRSSLLFQADDAKGQNLRRTFDHVDHGEPAVVFGLAIPDDPTRIEVVPDFS
jgi:hypothetical protein